MRGKSGDTNVFHSPAAFYLDYDNYYIDNDEDSDLPYFDTYESPALH